MSKKLDKILSYIVLTIPVIAIIYFIVKLFQI